MWPIWNFSDPNLRYTNFLSTGKSHSQDFIDNLILCDEIVLPTDDFMSLTILVGVLGFNAVSDMLDTGALRLVRAKGALCYIGNGGGLHPFKIVNSDGARPSVFLQADEAIEWAMMGLENIDKKQAQLMADKTLQNLTEIDLEDEEFNFREQTYADVVASEYLRTQLAVETDLSRLPGIGPKDVRIYGGKETQNDTIQSLLNLAHCNIELRLADVSNCDDITTAAPIGHLLRGKQERLISLGLKGATAKLKELASIPDIGTWIIQNPTGLEKLLELRASKAGGEFRECFHRSTGEEASTLEAEYIKLIREVPAASGLPARVIRFLVTAGWGLAEPITGAAAVVADQFFIDRYLNRKSPKFFLERLSQIPD